MSITSRSSSSEAGAVTNGSPYNVTGKGSITINADGSYSFTPAANFNGSFPVITYAITDGSGTNDTSTLSITITPGDDQVSDANETLSVADDSSANTGNLITGTASPDGPVSIISFSTAGACAYTHLTLPTTLRL